MTTRIPIQADPSSAIEAFRRVTEAIDKAGQAGKRFSEIDLDHPELKAVSEDLRVMERNFEDLRKVGRGATASAVRKGGPGGKPYEDFLQWMEGFERQFPEESARQRHFVNVSNYLTRGTRFETTPVAGAPARGRARRASGPQPQEEEKASRYGLAGVPLGGVVKTVLGIAGLSSVYHLLSSGVQSASEEAITVDTLMRSMADASESFGELTKRSEAAAKGLQLTWVETAKLSQAFAQAADDQSGRHVTAGVRTAAGFARAFGLQPGVVNQVFGQAERMKAGVDTHSSMRSFAEMIADAVGAGRMWSQIDTVLRDLTQYVSSQERVQMTTPNLQGYLGLSSAMNASGIPGLRGAAGNAIIGQVNAAIERGGNAGPAC